MLSKKKVTVSILSPTSKISEYFCKSPQTAQLNKGIKKDMLFVLGIVQFTFVTDYIVDLPTTGFNSQGMGTQAKTSNVAKHVPT